MDFSFVNDLVLLILLFVIDLEQRDFLLEMDFVFILHNIIKNNRNKFLLLNYNMPEIKKQKYLSSSFSENNAIFKEKINEPVLNRLASDLQDGNYDNVLFTLRNENVNVNDITKIGDNNNSAAHYILNNDTNETDKLQLLKLLHNNDTNLMTFNDYGISPLHIIAKKQYYDIYQFYKNEISLFSQYNKNTLLDNSGTSVLHYVVKGVIKDIDEKKDEYKKEMKFNIEDDEVKKQIFVQHINKKFNWDSWKIIKISDIQPNEDEKEEKNIEEIELIIDLNDRLENMSAIDYFKKQESTTPIQFPANVNTDNAKKDYNTLITGFLMNKMDTNLIEESLYYVRKTDDIRQSYLLPLLRNCMKEKKESIIADLIQINQIGNTMDLPFIDSFNLFYNGLEAKIDYDESKYKDDDLYDIFMEKIKSNPDLEDNFFNTLEREPRDTGDGYRENVNYGDGDVFINDILDAEKKNSMDMEKFKMAMASIKGDSSPSLFKYKIKSSKKMFIDTILKYKKAVKKHQSRNPPYNYLVKEEHNVFKNEKDTNAILKIFKQSINEFLFKGISISEKSKVKGLKTNIIDFIVGSEEEKKRTFVYIVRMIYFRKCFEEFTDKEFNAIDANDVMLMYAIFFKCKNYYATRITQRDSINGLYDEIYETPITLFEPISVDDINNNIFKYHCNWKNLQLKKGKLKEIADIIRTVSNYDIESIPADVEYKSYLEEGEKNYENEFRNLYIKLNLFDIDVLDDNKIIVINKQLVKEMIEDLPLLVNNTDSKDRTPLYYVTQYLGYDIAEYLLNNGAIIDDKTSVYLVKLYISYIEDYVIDEDKIIPIIYRYFYEIELDDEKKEILKNIYEKITPQPIESDEAKKYFNILKKNIKLILYENIVKNEPEHLKLDKENTEDYNLVQMQKYVISYILLFLGSNLFNENYRNGYKNISTLSSTIKSFYDELINAYKTKLEEEQKKKKILLNKKLHTRHYKVIGDIINQDDVIENIGELIKMDIVDRIRQIIVSVYKYREDIEMRENLEKVENIPIKDELKRFIKKELEKHFKTADKSINSNVEMNDIKQKIIFYLEGEGLEPSFSNELITSFEPNNYYHKRWNEMLGQVFDSIVKVYIQQIQHMENLLRFQRMIKLFFEY